MNLYIDACRFYPEKSVPIQFNKEERFEYIPGMHERLRLVLVQKGTGIIRINDKRVSIIAPSVLCINEKEDVILEDSINWYAQAFYFHPQYINSTLTFERIRQGGEQSSSITEKQDLFLFKPFIDRNEAYTGQIIIDQLNMSIIANLLDAVKHEVTEQSHRFWSCRARSYFIELLFTLMMVYQSPETRNNSIIINSSKLVNNIILFINMNYSNKITINELCMKFNMNRTTLQQQFQNSTGESVVSYIIRLRVRLSSLILKDTGITISEIAERLGFSDSTHFYKMFRKYMGCSPLQYRQQYKGCS